MALPLWNWTIILASGSRRFRIPVGTEQRIGRQRDFPAFATARDSALAGA
jgi:hypothetical protein